jgi:hypothetical protein
MSRVRPYAAADQRRTSIRSKQGTMPPWYIEKGIGHQQYKNDISLERRAGRDDRAVGGQRCAAGESGRHAAAS